MPPTKKAAAKPAAKKTAAAAQPVHSDVTAPTPPAAAAADDTVQLDPGVTPADAAATDVTPADDYGYQEPATNGEGAASGLVRYQLEDGSTAHGVVIGTVAGDTDREDAVQLVPLPEAITLPVSQLVSDDDDTED